MTDSAATLARGSRLRIPAQHADEQRDNDSTEQRRSVAGQTADETLTGELATMELQL
jgi:hypothetical protein